MIERQVREKGAVDHAMRALLTPRSANAYGQDFLGKAIAETCGLTVVTASKNGYVLPGNLRLVVSMNLDKRIDSDLVSMLPRDVRVIAHVHCRYHYFSQAQKHNLASSLERVSVGIVAAPFHRQELQALFPAVDWRVVHNGVDQHRFRIASDTERRAFRQRFAIGEGQKVVLFVGRLESAKGLEILTAFCAQLACTNLVILIQYLANSERARQTYTDVANELRARNPRQVFVYPDTDLSADRPVRHADLLLMPSLCEVAPLVVLEAFSAGVPVLGTRATPFYDQFQTLAIPTDFFHFIPLPDGLDVERKDLRIGNAAAGKIASELLEIADGWSIATDEKRTALSQATRNAGFGQEMMISAYKTVYDDVCSCGS